MSFKRKRRPKNRFVTKVPNGFQKQQRGIETEITNPLPPIIIREKLWNANVPPSSNKGIEVSRQRTFKEQMIRGFNRDITHGAKDRGKIRPSTGQVKTRCEIVMLDFPGLYVNLNRDEFTPSCFSSHQTKSLLINEIPNQRNRKLTITCKRTDPSV